MTLKNKLKLWNLMNRVDTHRFLAKFVVFMFAGVLFLSAILVLSKIVKPVLASHNGPCPLAFNRCANHGYFGGNDYPGGGADYVMSTGAGYPSRNGMPVYNTDEFISFMFDRLNQINSYTPTSLDVRQDQIGAAMIINTMLGRSGTDFDCGGSLNGGCIDSRDAGIITAQSDFAIWESRVRLYGSGVGGRSVQWDTEITLPAGFINSAFDYRNPYRDDFFYQNSAADTQFSIIFTNPDGTQYIIKKNCGNPVGGLSPLVPNPPPTGYNNVPALVGAPSSPVEPGQIINFWGSVTNIGTGASPNLTLYAINPDPAQITGTGSGGGVTGGSPFAGGYRWSPEPGVPAGTSVAGFTFGFKIGADVPDGQVYCFRFRVEPGSGQSTPSHTVDPPGFTQTEQCYTVFRSRHPFLTTEGGDVHAGTRFAPTPCLVNPTTPRTVTGTTDGSNVGSKADYILSSSGVVVDSGSGSLRRRFGSSGSPSNNSLTFGNSPSLGNYGELCRPDLATQLLGEPGGVIAGVTNVNVLANDTVSKYTGNAILAGGSLANGHHKTLVVDGDVYITSNITRSVTNYANKKAIPSFALIATGNIYIHPSVTSLYGIYYAGRASNPAAGTINTCSNNGVGPSIVAAGGAALCANNLQIDGALIATRIVLRRTFGGVEPFATRSAAENVVFQPGLLLSPPPGFSSLLNQIKFTGELPPVY
jgi:hypothetical protein